MAWPATTPYIRVLDTRPFKQNIVDHIKLYQSDALAWANTGSAVPLAPIKAFHLTPDISTVFPALTFIDDSHASNYGEGDIAIFRYSVTLELAIAHGKLDELAKTAPKYVMALESMLVNVPETIFTTNSIITSVINGGIEALSSAMLVQGKMNNRFVQFSEIKASWDLTIGTFG